MESITFDRAAGFYDQTRGFPPGVAEQVTAKAAELIGPARRVLEVGIGTGRIARPLMAHGYGVTGVDLSRRMMEQCLEALGPGDPRPALVQGDATRLPLASAVFDAAVTVHVFHLIAGWRQAVDEIRRSLRPGGVLLSGYERRPDGYPGSLLQKRWREIVGGKGYERLQPGMHDFEDVQRAVAAMGAAAEEHTVGEWQTTRSVARHIESIEHRTWSATWAVPDTLFPECLGELRAWAVEQWGGLDREFTTPHTFVWHRFQWQG
jgi:SAM-dependent methyltransferase